jgi:RHS repeat-associated protein
MTRDTHCAGQYPWDAEHVGDFVGGYVIDTREWRVVYEECWHHTELYDYIEARYDRTFERICKWECLYTPPADFFEVGLCSEKQNYIDAGVSPDDLVCGCYRESETDGSDQTPLYKRDSNSGNCNVPDVFFPPIPDHHVTLFTWDEEGNNRSSECAYQHGIKQNARINCQEQYRCIRHTDECQWERNEHIGSYVSPRDGVFHEDIDIDGTAYTLHYQSADVAVGSIADGWSVSAHAVLKEDTLYMGDGMRYLVDTVEQEGGNTIYPLGAIELVFDAENRHVATRDSYTKSVIYTFAYDANHDLIGITDRFSNTTTIMHDADGKTERIIAPHGQVTLLDVNDYNDLASVIYEDSATYTFEYEDHLMTKEREPKGNAFLHIFNDQGKIVEVVDAEQGEWNFAQESETNAELNNVIRASGDSVQYRNHHLNNGFLRYEKIAPNGDVTTKESAVDESETRIAQCGVEKVYRFKTENGVLAKDPVENKRLLASSTTTMPSGLQSVASYNHSYTFSNGEINSTLKTITNNGNTTTIVRDYIGSTATMTSPEGRTTHIVYDKTSLLPLSVQYADLEPENYLYDDEGRVIETTKGRRVTRFSYDSRGNLAQQYDVLKDSSTFYSYDERDRLTEVVYPDGHTTRFSYDANGNMNGLTTPTPSDHAFSHNGVNKRTGYTSPLGAVTRYGYDKQRRVTQITRASGKTVVNTYTNGQLSSVGTQEGTATYSYDCGGKPASVAKGDEKLTFAYDGDLLTRIDQEGALDHTLTFTYNNDFNVASAHYAGGTTTYGYDKDGLLVQSGDFKIERDPVNGLSRAVTDGIHTLKNGYNNFGEIKSQRSNAFSYQLKRTQGRISQKTETIVKTVPNKKGKGGIKVREKNAYAYVYDDRDRLIEVQKDGIVTEAYTYDANGNRASATVNGTTKTASYTLDDRLEVYGDNTYYYDEDGYLSEKTAPEGTTTYIYGTLGELRSVTLPDGTVIEYLHNANNQRVAKMVNGVVTEKYLWQDLTTLLAVYDGSNNLKIRFNYAEGRMPIAMIQVGQKYYLHYDQVDTLKAVSTEDGTIIKIVEYDTFGNVLLDSNPAMEVPFGFAGGLYDTDIGLSRFGYRDYDAETGKWTTKDPIGFAGGDTNLYGYVLGDPVNFVDPEGLWSFSYEFFYGIGAGFKFGSGNNGPFFAFKAGRGTSIGLSFDPSDQGRFNHGHGSYSGVYCEAGVTLADSSVTVDGILGVQKQNGFNLFYDGGPAISYSPKGWGFKAGYNAGVESGVY